MVFWGLQFVYLFGLLVGVVWFFGGRFGVCFAVRCLVCCCIVWLHGFEFAGGICVFMDWFIVGWLIVLVSNLV